MRFLTSLSIVLFLSSLPAQKGIVSVLHGIPGLPKPVDVFANGGKLFSFDYGEFKGPLALDPATYKLEVKLDGKTVLSANAKVEAGKNYTVIAHLKEKSGIALAVFLNDTSSLSRYKSRLQVRHLADAPAVDVLAKRWWFTKRLFKNVRNGQEGKTEVYAGTYSVSLNAAGTNKRAFGPVKLSLGGGKIYAVHAIGKLGEKSFRLFVQTVVQPTGSGALVGKVRGKACGGAISLSTTSPEFGKPYDVILEGGTANGYGFLHTGLSDSRFLLFRLPLDLGFLGASGCRLYQNTQVIQLVKLDAKGGVKVSQTVPNTWAPWFREIHHQYSFRAPGKNRVGLLLTEYASVEKK
ncbi:MAG: DUF4397 domain-containing protein [Planctomycetota bacterium]|jgi:hypothetical protein